MQSKARSGTVFSLVTLLLVSRLTIAQAAPDRRLEKPPDKLTLASILAHLDDNIDDFNRTVPSFLCKESVTSEMDPGPSGTALRTSTTSTFLVRRSDDPDEPVGDSKDPTETIQFHESRIVKSIDANGFKPEEGAKKADDPVNMNNPYVVFGIFSGGLTRVSTPGEACFHYRLEPTHRGNDSGHIVIDFASWPHNDLAHNCPYSDQISGRAVVDPTSMRVVHLENTTVDATGTWTWSVDYSPIALSGKTFWVPATIHSQDVTVTDTPQDPVLHASNKTTVTHRLVARYSDYRERGATPPVTPRN